MNETLWSQWVFLRFYRKLFTIEEFGKVIQVSSSTDSVLNDTGLFIDWLACESFLEHV